MFHLVSYKWIRRTQVIPELGVDYNVCGDRVVDVKIMNKSIIIFFIEFPISGLGEPEI